MKENWKPVVGYEGLYEISDRGRVRSVTRTVVRSDGSQRTYIGTIRKQTVRSSGQRHVVLLRNGKARVVLVSHLMKQAFSEEDRSIAPQAKTA